MTRILISAATLIALTMSAAASPLPAKYYLSKMPQQFRGEWCAQHPLWTRGAKACPAISVVEITADGFQDSNHRCEAMKIIKDNPRNPKNYDMKLWCGTLDDVGLTGSIDPSPARWIENCSMRFVNGKLEFTTDEAE